MPLLGIRRREETSILIDYLRFGLFFYSYARSFLQYANLPFSCLKFYLIIDVLNLHSFQMIYVHIVYSISAVLNVLYRLLFIFQIFMCLKDLTVSHQIREKL